MHDTAQEIGRLAIDIYADKKAKILELGSMDVNGSLRQFAPDGCSYTGVDLEPGKSVDLVVKPGEPLPFSDSAFDLILASSVFEHDPAFWSTFLDLVRLVKEGGYIYVNAPSNGKVHRYPEDHWRFYPDSGLALERWATSQKLPVKLIESFTAPRQKDMWNDFVAVFRRGEHEDELIGRFLHTSFGANNIWTIGADKPLRPYEPTEDMVLLDVSDKKLKALEPELEKTKNALKDAEDRLHSLQSNMVQREEELTQVRASLDTADARYSEQTKALLHQQKETIRLENEKTKAVSSLAVCEALLTERNEAIETAENSIQQRFSELAKLTKMLKTAEKRGQENETRAHIAMRERQSAEARLDAQLEHAKWLAEVHTNLSGMKFWTALLPPKMRARRKIQRLRAAGLFDGDKYLDLYPDVRAEGMDPLRHYILHGVSEERRRPA